jgi:hypothetical protein
LETVITTGGEIRHTEIRANFVPTVGAEQNPASVPDKKGEN